MDERPRKGDRPTKQISYKIDRLSIDPSGPGPATVRLNGFGFNTGHPQGHANIGTDLGVRDGEKVVVGTSTLKDRGLIVVLVAKVLR